MKHAIKTFYDPTTHTLTYVVYDQDSRDVAWESTIVRRKPITSS